MAELFLEVQEILLGVDIRIEEKREANGAAVIREKIDAGFGSRSDWDKISAGGIDWQKRIRYNRSMMASLGVEVQVSARSDLLVRDIVHLRNSIDAGDIEAGIIVVPSDAMQSFLPDRTPSLSDAVKYIESEFKEAMTMPLIVIAVEHDGTGPATAKRKRRA
ncbi:MAG: hypothetical protein IT350_18030 [Deltaproteobacteria bacterium]|nr:hypothetical protein [Deltaproteobacteria bacterium]